jgi:Holliday junction resolvase RusA-like endonuclease
MELHTIKPKQNFADAVLLYCSRTMSQSCWFSTKLCADARIKIEIHFRFPSPKTGQIKNTADIDNLCKFILDACNETFYGDDGQVVCLYADKDYDDEYGGKGYTKVKIQVNERQWKAVS